jgi:SAM-dependent methyltransferase
MSQAPAYDRLGASYTATRHPDPRIASLVRSALGDVRSVVNVGAGAGAYEPPGLEVLAIEPSEVMIAQRPTGAPPAIGGWAEHLPVEDDSFDAAMAVMTLHHWSEWRKGVRELRRAARRRVVVFTFDPASLSRLWIARDYLPAIIERHRAFPSLEDHRRELGGGTVVPVPIPHDCSDGFLGAFWRRPGAYLDPRVRAGISTFADLDEDACAEGLRRLARDLRTGAWHRRHRALLRREALDPGYRLLVKELDRDDGPPTDTPTMSRPTSRPKSASTADPKVSADAAFTPGWDDERGVCRRCIGSLVAAAFVETDRSAGPGFVDKQHSDLARLLFVRGARGGGASVDSRFGLAKQERHGGERCSRRSAASRPSPSAVLVDGTSRMPSSRTADRPPRASGGGALAGVTPATARRRSTGRCFG